MAGKTEISSLRTVFADLQSEVGARRITSSGEATTRPAAGSFDIRVALPGGATPPGSTLEGR